MLPEAPALEGNYTPLRGADGSGLRRNQHFTAKVRDSGAVPRAFALPPRRRCRTRGRNSSRLYPAESTGRPRWVNFGEQGRAKFGERRRVADYQRKKGQLREAIEALARESEQLKTLRKQTPRHIPVKDLPESDRFSRLLTERKHFVDTVKLIAYRAETSMASVLREKLSRPDDARSLLRQIYNTEAGLIGDLDDVLTEYPDPAEDPHPDGFSEQPSAQPPLPRHGAIVCSVAGDLLTAGGRGEPHRPRRGEPRQRSQLTWSLARV